MQELFKYCRSAFVDDAISNCAKNLKDLQKLKATYPPEKDLVTDFSINLKA